MAYGDELLRTKEALIIALDAIYQRQLSQLYVVYTGLWVYSYPRKYSEFIELTQNCVQRLSWFAFVNIDGRCLRAAYCH